MDGNTSILEEIIENKNDFILMENSYFNTYKKDENGNLITSNPNLKYNDFNPICECCTYTFEGVKIPFKKTDLESVVLE